MKKQLFFFIVAVLFTACKHVDEPKVFAIDPTAMVYIKPATTTQKAFAAVKSTDKHLTSLEIVKRATTMRFFNDKLSNNDCAAGFAGKDTTSEVPAFLRYGTDVINNDGFGKPYLVPDFVYAYDCVIEIFRSNHDIDTIAYIPNAVLRKAENDIISALEAQDTTAVYGIFKDAFKFLPITGAEYRELKRQNLQ